MYAVVASRRVSEFCALGLIETRANVCPRRGAAHAGCTRVPTRVCRPPVRAVCPGWMLGPNIALSAGRTIPVNQAVITV